MGLLLYPESLKNQNMDVRNIHPAQLIFLRKRRLPIRFVLILFIIFITNIIKAAGITYYSTNNADASSTSSWHTNPNGSGTSPSNFKNDGDIFVIQAGQYLTSTANWNIKGTNAAVIIESSATLRADDKITVDNFQIYSGGTYIHNTANNNFPGSNIRTLASDSNVEIWNWNGGAALPDPTVWGNLTLNVNSSYNSNWNMAGKLTDIAGNFRIISTGDPSKELRLATNQDYTLNIGGDLIIEGGQIDAGNSNTVADQIIILNGSYIQSGGSFTCSNNKSPEFIFQFNGGNSYYTKSGGTLTSTYIDWVVNANKKLTLNNDFSVSLDRLFTINGTLDVSTKQINGLGNFTLASTGTLSTSHTSGLNGSLILSGLLSLITGGSYEFHAPTSIPFLSLTGTVSATNLLVDANVAINKDVNVAGTLTLSNGKLTIPASQIINITSGNDIGGTGFDNTKHIATEVNTVTGTKGILQIGNFTGTRTFPLGNGTYYLPVLLSASGTNDFSVCVFSGATVDGTPNGTAFTSTEKKTMVDAIWIVNRNGGSSNTTMQLSWQNALEGSNFSTYSNSNIGISHYSGSWDAASGSGNQAANTATRNSISSFSPFMVEQSSIPLSLKFMNIKANIINSGMQISWTSLSETNVDHYDIERSKGGQLFKAAGQIRATTDHTSSKNYSWFDIDPSDEAPFYRIKAVEKSGKYIYSKIIKIASVYLPVKDVILFPNPVQTSHITIKVKNINAGEYKCVISDILGRPIYSKSFNHSGGVFNENIQLPSGINRGNYILKITGENTNVAKAFSVQ